MLFKLFFSVVEHTFTMSFAIYEDDMPEVVDVKPVKSDQRAFGTLLSNNRQPSQIPVAKTSVRHFGAVLAEYTKAELLNSNVLEDQESLTSIESTVAKDCSVLSAPFPSLASLLEGDDVLNSTKLLLSEHGYFDEISTYLFSMEKKFRCDPNYMSRQNDISHPMRSVLAHWLVEIVDEYKLQRRTLFLSVAIMDLFLSKMSVVRNKLQLLGVTCLFVASKFEEIYPPEANDFAYLTEDTYTVAQIIKLERMVLKVLDFQLGFPTVDVMCDRITAACQLPSNQVDLINYLSELTLVHGEPFLQYLPSVVAAACVCLSNICLSKSEDKFWTAELEVISGKSVHDFYYCLVLLGDVMRQALVNDNCKTIVARYEDVSKLLPDQQKITSLFQQSKRPSGLSLRL